MLGEAADDKVAHPRHLWPVRSRISPTAHRRHPLHLLTSLLPAKRPLNLAFCAEPRGLVLGGPRTEDAQVAMKVTRPGQPVVLETAAREEMRLQ